MVFMNILHFNELMFGISFLWHQSVFDTVVIFIKLIVDKLVRITYESITKRAYALETNHLCIYSYKNVTILGIE